MASTAVSLKTLISEEKLLIHCPAGLTIGELMDEAKVPLDLRGYIMPLNHGLPVRDLDYVTRPGDRITFAVTPQGKGAGMILAAVAMIALAIVAPYLGGLFAGSVLGLTSGTAAYTFAASAVALGITMVGSLLVSALVPPPSVANTKSESVAAPLQESPTYSVTGQSNQARKYSPIPRIYGRHRFFPNIANTPLIENEGKTSRITALYDFGYGDITVQDVKIGEIPVGVIQPDIRVHQNTQNPPLQLVSKSVSYDQLQYRLERDQTVTVRTKDQSTSATIDIQFPRGLVRYDSSGNRAVATVALEVYYRPVGGAWSRVPGWQFRGMDVDVQRVVWSTAYVNGVTEWMETTFNGGDNKWQDVEIRQNGAYYGRWVYGIGGTPQEMYTAGVQFRKGGARDSGTINAKASYVKYELQVAVPVSSDSTVLSAATGQPLTCAVHIPFPAPGVYEIAVVRKNDISDSNSLYNEAFLTLIKSFKGGDIIRLDKPHTMLEMSVVASDKISGVIQNLSAICMSRLRWHDGTGWQPPQETRNPVWIVLDILTGGANKTPLRDEQLDMPSWLRLAAICDELVTTTVNGITTTQPRYMCDVVIDFRTTVQEIVSSILSMCRAQLIITQSGKYGVLIDAEQTVPRQVFTPANSWGFTGTRAFTDKPHAFRVSFTDPDLAWQTAEFNVYNDDYSEANATNIEDLQSFGITTYAQAYRFGRYMMAQGIHRSEVFSIKTDVENLAVQRGELVHVAHDVPKVGGMFARVKAIDGNVITIDQSVGTTPTAYTVRLSDGSIRSGTITLAIDGSNFELDTVTGLETGDLVVIGQTDRVVGKFLVLDITPGADLTAEISLVPYVPAIYQADQGPIPDWDPQYGGDAFATDLVVSDLSVSYRIDYFERRPFGRSLFTWKTTGFNLDRHDITVKIGNVPEFSIGPTSEQVYEWLVDLLSRPELAGNTATITVEPVSKTGLIGKSASISVTLSTDKTSPNPPGAFALNVQSENIVLFWQIQDDPDIDYYELRYTPNVTTPTWDSAQQLARVGYQQTRVSTGARTGTYMIRAVDTSGNKSTVAYQRTTVETLPNINVIEIVDDSLETPPWPGAASGLVKQSGLLLSAGDSGAVVPEGVYTVAEIVDLEEIYEARVSSMIEAYGAAADDFMAGWLTLDSVGFLAGETADKWDAWVEVAVSSEQIVMSSWTPNLNAVGTIGGINGAVWSEWRPVNVGDFTGRLFKFRIVTRSYDPAVKVVVQTGRINVDMPDRIWSENDVDIPVAGLTINFDPAFRDLPALAVTIDGNSEYLVAEITNKSAASFDLKLRNTSGVAKAGKVDVMAKGYGRLRSATI